MNYSQHKGSGLIIGVILLAVIGAGTAYFVLSSDKEVELTPNEQAFFSALTAGEALANQENFDSSTCTLLKGYIDDSQEAFKKILPGMKPFEVRKNDDRIGDLKTFAEAQC